MKLRYRHTFSTSKATKPSPMITARKKTMTVNEDITNSISKIGFEEMEQLIASIINVKNQNQQALVPQIPPIIQDHRYVNYPSSQTKTENITTTVHNTNLKIVKHLKDKERLHNRKYTKIYNNNQHYHIFPPLESTIRSHRYLKSYLTGPHKSTPQETHLKHQMNTK